MPHLISNCLLFVLPFHTGSDIYALNTAAGNAVPPQFYRYGKLVDEVIQSSFFATYYNDPELKLDAPSIHQAGTYGNCSLGYDHYPADVAAECRANGPGPVKFNPTLGVHCYGDTCTVLTWGQFAHTPTSHLSPMLIANRYKNCGNGII